MSMKIVIIGGVAVGATAAARLRRLSEEYEIVLFERGEFISFANCGLPYHIGGVIEKREKLLVQTVDGMKQRFNLDIRNFSEVTKINRAEKTVDVTNLKTSEKYSESYDFLILSPGAKPIVPPIEGLKKSNNVFSLRNIPDTDKIISFIKTNSPKKAVVVGGGFIGIEIAENLKHLGLDVTIVELLNQVMPVFDFEMAQFIHRELSEQGIQLQLGSGLKQINNSGKTVVLNNGIEIETDLIILAIGVVAENQLAKECGLEIGPTGGVVVDDKMLTNDPNIFAAGDVIEVKSMISNQPAKIPLAWPANRQARLIADRIHGLDKRYTGSLGTSVIKIFNSVAASTGLSENALKRYGISNYHTIHIHPNNHAGYYPGASSISLKLIFEKITGKIYGAQAFGKEGTEKRIDVLATSIKAGFTIYDLQELELAYAPPFSSAKDPVNMLGYVSEHVLEGEIKSIQWNQLDDFKRHGGTILDVRTPLEFSKGNIQESINIEIDSLREFIHELDKEKTYAILCQVGMRAYNALKILQNSGFKNLYLISGGYKLYEVASGNYAEINEPVLVE